MKEYNNPLEMHTMQRADGDGMTASYDIADSGVIDALHELYGERDTEVVLPSCAGGAPL